MNFLIGLGVVAVILYVWYSSIISRKNTADEAFSGIDVQLKKRTDLIPNILTIASKFMEHEKGLLEEITRLRSEVMKKSGSEAHMEDRLKAESLLEGKMGQFMVSVENYPDLKSQQNMVEAQRVYADVEEHISAARRSYNAATTSLKNAIQIFPGNVLAGFMGITAMPYFDIPEVDRKPVNAGEFLK